MSLIPSTFSFLKYDKPKSVRDKETIEKEQVMQFIYLFPIYFIDNITRIAVVFKFVLQKR